MRQRFLFGLVGQFGNSRSIRVLSQDGMSTKAKDVNDMGRGCEAFHGHGVDSIMLKVSIFKVVLISDIHLFCQILLVAGLLEIAGAPGFVDGIRK